MNELRTTNSGSSELRNDERSLNIAEESNLVLQSQHSLTIVIASCDAY